MSKARRTQPQMPSDFPKLPDNWIFIGHKDQITPIGKSLVCQYATFLAGTTWNITTNFLPNTNVYLAAPIDSDLHKAQLWHPINAENKIPHPPRKKVEKIISDNTPQTLVGEIQKVRDMIKNIEKMASKTIHNGHYLSNRSVKLVTQLCWELNGVSGKTGDSPLIKINTKNVTDELRGQGFDVQVGKTIFVNLPKKEEKV